jgi:hypothetical protein
MKGLCGGLIIEEIGLSRFDALRHRTMNNNPPRSIYSIVSSGETTVQMVKIQITDREASIRAFGALIRRGRVDTYRDDVYVIPEPDLEMLGEMGIPFIELGRGGPSNESEPPITRSHSFPVNSFTNPGQS